MNPIRLLTLSCALSLGLRAASDTDWPQWRGPHHDGSTRMSGLPATLGVVSCFVLIAVAGVGIAMQALTVFNRCLALGLTCLIVVPAIQNIGVTTALLPNDGLPLPFVSYGGTSLVLSLAAVGMLVGIHRRSQIRVLSEFPLDAQKRLAVRL